MKALRSKPQSVNHGTNLPKLRQKRIRTWSSDSGCDVACDYSDILSSIMDDSIQSWTGMLDRVVRQEVEKAKKVTSWAKEEISHAREDEGMRQEILESCRRQVEGIMDRTKDLVESVNNDVKENISESLERLPASVMIDQITEADEEQELKEPYHDTSGEIKRTKRKADVQVQPLKAKINRHDEFKQINFVLFDDIKLADEVSRATTEGINQGQNMIELCDLFDDWDWNSDEFDFEDLDDLDDLEKECNLHVNFYDEPGIEANWNNFNFWKLEETYFDEIPRCIDTVIEEAMVTDYEKLCIDIKKQDLIVWEDPKATDLIMKYQEENYLTPRSIDYEEYKDYSPIISDDENDEECSSPRENYLHFWLNEINRASTVLRKDQNGNWTTWNFWDYFGSVKEITEAYADTFDFKDTHDVEDSLACYGKCHNASPVKNERKVSEKDKRKDRISMNAEKNSLKKLYIDINMSPHIKRQHYSVRYFQCRLKDKKTSNYLNSSRVKRRLAVKMFPKQPR